MKKSNLIKILVAIIFVGIVIALRYSPLRTYLTFKYINEHKEALKFFVNRNFILSSFSYIALYIVITAFSVPGAAILTLAGGFIFGLFFAVIYVNIGATIGAVFAFLVSRYLLGITIQECYSKKLNKFNQELKRNGVSYLFTLRLIPIFPFFLINLFAGLTRLSLFTFFWTTSLGIIPGSFVYSFAGSQLEKVSSPADVLSSGILIAFLLLALLALLPVFIRWCKKKRR